MEAARKNNSPVMIQVSNGGGAFYAGKGVKDPNNCAAGAVALGMHVRLMAAYYGIPVVLHSDHCAKKLLPWFDGMMAADEEFFKQYGEPLYSSHMLDLSEESDEENIAICAKYFEKLVKMKIWLEMEIGITGGEEDGVDNEGGRFTIITIVCRFSLFYSVAILYVCISFSPKLILRPSIPKFS